MGIIDGLFNAAGHDRTRQAIERSGSINPEAAMANDRHLAAEIDKLRRHVNNSVHGITNRVTELVSSHVDFDERLRALEDDVARAHSFLGQQQSWHKDMIKRVERLEAEIRSHDGELDALTSIERIDRHIDQLHKKTDGNGQDIRQLQDLWGEMQDGGRSEEVAISLLQRWYDQYGRNMVRGVQYEHLCDLAEETKAWLGDRA